VTVFATDQALPSKWRIVASSGVHVGEPTAHTSFFELPHTARSWAPVWLSGAVNAAPSQWRIKPAAPTNHTSFAELPHAP
jgi:hypothetical protein